MPRPLLQLRLIGYSYGSKFISDLLINYSRLIAIISDLSDFYFKYWYGSTITIIENNYDIFWLPVFFCPPYPYTQGCLVSFVCSVILCNLSKVFERKKLLSIRICISISIINNIEIWRFTNVCYHFDSIYTRIVSVSQKSRSYLLLGWAKVGMKYRQDPTKLQNNHPPLST